MHHMDIAAVDGGLEHNRQTGLTQEEVDLLSAHLETTEITDVAVARVLEKLDDSESGTGWWPDDWQPHCQKCKSQINDGELMGTAFGNFYHDGCVPGLSTGPMPLGQYLGGVR